MATYRIGNHSFEAENLVAAIDYVKSKGLAGRLIRIKGSVDAAPVQHTDDRVVTSTCSRWQEVDGKWVKHTHRWTGLLSEVVANKNVCPEHRS